MKAKIAVQHHEAITNIKAKSKQSVLESLQKAKIPIGFSCGGEGVCTTCRIILVDGDLSEPTEIEARRSKERGFKSNERLSCQCKPISESIKIIVP